jgi:two-component system nitrogen regulation sensor histidine kinase NtrY
LLHRVQLLKQKELQERGIELILSAGQNIPEMNIDPELTEQILINLINNATDALTDQAHPSIELSVVFGNDLAVIKVLDNGTGIPPETLPKIFIPFYTTKKNGSGIGLSLAKQIMQLHKGSIAVHSEAGTGTLFCLSFPNG